MREKTITIRVTTGEKDMFESAARADEREFSDWARRALAAATWPALRKNRTKKTLYLDALIEHEERPKKEKGEEK